MAAFAEPLVGVATEETRVVGAGDWDDVVQGVRFGVWAHVALLSAEAVLRVGRAWESRAAEASAWHLADEAFV
jgi:hypothetical protein